MNAASGRPRMKSGPITCTDCKSILASRSHLGQHRRRVHGPPVSAGKIEINRQNQAKPGNAPRPNAGAASVLFTAKAAGAVEPDAKRLPMLTRWMNRANPAVEPVSAEIISLPWISFPRSRADCVAILRSVDVALERAAAGSELERKFWTTLGDHVAAIAARAANS